MEFLYSLIKPKMITFLSRKMTFPKLQDIECINLVIFAILLADLHVRSELESLLSPSSAGKLIVEVQVSCGGILITDVT